MEKAVSHGPIKEIDIQVLTDGGDVPGSIEVIAEELKKVDPGGKKAHEITKRYRGRRLWGPKILSLW